jgi:hypothetical protein
MSDENSAPAFSNQCKLMNTLAREMNPTRNSPCKAHHYIARVEHEFAKRGWNFSAFCMRVSGDSWEKKQKVKPTSPLNVEKPLDKPQEGLVLS